MLYSPEQFKSLDEAHALADGMVALAPRLYEILSEANADIKSRYPADLFWENQNRVNVSRLVNQRCARLWKNEGWVLDDMQGYLHLREEASGLRAVLRRVDPITRSLPKSNATKAGKAYYLQRTCRGAGSLSPVAQDSFLSLEAGMITPDLGDARLILAWQDNDGILTVTAYRPLAPGSYGGSNRFDFSLELSDDSGMTGVEDFTPIEDEANLLPDLLLDNTDESAPQTAPNVAEKQ